MHLNALLGRQIAPSQQSGSQAWMLVLGTAYIAAYGHAFRSHMDEAWYEAQTYYVCKHISPRWPHGPTLVQ